MKEKWKLDNQSATFNCNLEKAIVHFTYFLLLVAICSCNDANEHKHFQTNSSNELNELVKSTNQTVFSEIKTISATQQKLNPILQANGIIEYDPQLINNISARFNGRIEKLYVRFNFENVSKGQRIMDINSTEILAAQHAFIYLLKNSSNDIELIQSTKQKLKLLGITNEQLIQIETSKQAINPLPIYSPYSGHIHGIGISSEAISSASLNNGMNSKMGNSDSESNPIEIENQTTSQSSSLTIKEGMYLTSGQAIFSVYNTNKVWGVLTIFQKDAAFIDVGDKVQINSETNPNNVITSNIHYIEPVVGQNSATIKARVYLQNEQHLQLKIGTLLSAKIYTSEINGMWLPRNAVINLGKKQIVFLKNKNNFIAKTIQTGFETDTTIQIISGLKLDEKVAANAQYLVDSESFIKSNENE